MLELKKMDFEEKKRHERDTREKAAITGLVIFMIVVSILLWMNEKGVI